MCGDEGDIDYMFPGSDDKFDADDLQEEEEYDILDREQDHDGPGLDDSPPCSPLQSSPASSPDPFLHADSPFSPPTTVESIVPLRHLPLPCVQTRYPVLRQPWSHHPQHLQVEELVGAEEEVMVGVEVVVGVEVMVGVGACRRQAVTGQPGGEEQNERASEPSPVTVEPFTQPIRPTIQLGSGPLEVFTSLFTPALFNHIVLETNKYAALCLTSTHQGEGRSPTWETDAAEIRAYLRFAILMGSKQIIPCPPSIVEYNRYMSGVNKAD